eukprot:CAMPEP_0194275640 /NCGR_PEP_ID=MMETSP0169-20130528/8426_1 /TAXON_ID=218684 /ORGANISM="Corethron pennatum, Strain L29A3" /LENGTH=40 /DNA_ID= /DNA_START= /DNA_END= /DNA_ORIENTATION=
MAASFGAKMAKPPLSSLRRAFMAAAEVERIAKKVGWFSVR